MMPFLTSLQTLPPLAGGFFGLLMGLAAGVLHFASLKRVAELYTGGGPIGRTLALHIARFALIVAVLVLLALIGALPLLSGALGILIARALVLRFTKEPA
ncbi:ATP synthase subunit I [Breoghania sp.]|uniref:ATP synthase subunit I n=1 Tax=Breoghania sp. TaxID=2065378 RepID=UPI002AAAEB07|nr:ATP synthase subunit I [Breoghania sp.]